LQSHGRVQDGVQHVLGSGSGLRRRIACQQRKSDPLVSATVTRRVTTEGKQTDGESGQGGEGGPTRGSTHQAHCRLPWVTPSTTPALRCHAVAVLQQLASAKTPNKCLRPRAGGGKQLHEGPAAGNTTRGHR
jgi:hypothetical protein